MGSPGTLAEVLRGYSGDRQAPQRLQWPLFNLMGRGYQRRFELATLRLQNMQKVLGRWRTYVPTDTTSASAAAPSCSKPATCCSARTATPASSASRPPSPGY